MSKNLTEAEFWWMVGILEGEGFFGYHTTQRVAVSMTDEDTMLKVSAIFTKITRKEHKLRNDAVSIERQNRGDKECFTVDLYGDNARTIMLMVVPHMCERRRQRIWQSLNEYKAPKQIVKLDIGQILEFISAKK